MSIEMRCTGCGQTLRVADEHAGKKARCPACGTIVQVPPAGAGPASSPQPAAESRSPFAPEATSPGAENPFADRPEPQPNPYASPATPAVTTSGIRARPHRGGLILTLGILGLLCCGPLGIVAWVMGSSDLNEIRQGRMDPSGQSLTQAGMVIGIIATVVLILGVLVNLAAMIAGMA
jgi:hypothetical protein